MAKIKKNRTDGFVFSTNSKIDLNNPFGNIFGNTEADYNNEDSRPESEQRLYVSIDRKRRNGKEVTLIEGFEGSVDELKNLAKTLKQKCGVGGSAKDGDIMIQGKHKEKIVKLLKEMGYFNTKPKGGN